jgi:octaprenyl-diphosphate synthase
MSMPVPWFYHLVAAHMQNVEKLLSATIAEETVLHPPLRHIIQSGGKRLRPLLTLLCGRLQGACVATCLPSDGDELSCAAAAIEALHTASLLHDDILDKAEWRRGAAAVNKVWGNEVAMLTGDYFYATAVELLARANNVEAIRIFAAAAKCLCQGEAAELMERPAYGAPISDWFDRYFMVIEKKTAALFIAACEIASAVAGGTAQDRQSLHSYGLCLGTILQISDDILDLTGETGKIGKKLGMDVQQGVLTLPVIYALEESNDTAVLWQILDNRDYPALGKTVRASQAIARCYAFAHKKAEEACAALLSFPDSDYRRALCDLAAYLVAREK